MIISNIKLNNFPETNLNNLSKNKVEQSQTSSVKSLNAYPANYYVSFGTRNVKTVYDAYKDTEMPSTVRDYIEDLRVTSRNDEFEIIMCSPRLYQVQSAAFEKLADCKTIEDIQRTFPNEKYFKNLRKSTDVRPDGKGIFNLVSKKEKEGVKVFDLDEDLTVYFVKKLFLECKSMTDIQKDLVEITFDSEVKERIPGASTWCADTFAPLGIEIPDGKHYRSALLYSEDQKYRQILSEALSRSWENLSPEEVTERIQSLLQGIDKEKYTMIDTWNNCIPIRKKLSDFMFENYDSEKYNQKSNSKNYEGRILQTVFHKGTLDDKMRKLMNDFWRNNPDAKRVLSEQIKISRKVYDEKKAQGPEALKAHIDSIMDKSNLIRAQLLAEREKNRTFKVATSFIHSIANKTNDMYLRTPETDEDFYNILLKHFTNEQLMTYESHLVTGNKSDEFSLIYPPKSQIIAAKSSLEYANLLNSQISAIIEHLISQGKVDEKSLMDAMQDEGKLDSLIANSSVLPEDCSSYSTFKQPLTETEKEEIVATIMKYSPQDNEVFKDNLNLLLNTQGKYFTLVNSENRTLKTAISLLVLKKIDELCGSDSVNKFLEEQKKTESQMKKIDYVKNMNWSNLKAMSWDV